MIGVFAAGVACGLLGNKLAGGKPLPPDFAIHSGHEGLTNPLLECEISEYLPGRALRPFKEALEELLQRQQEEGRATHISLYFRDLDNGPWMGIDEDREFTPASLLKVPVIMAAMKQAESDPALLRREVRFTSFADDSRLARFQTANPLVLGRSYRLEELVRRAASDSDNFATRLLGLNIDRNVLRKLLYVMGLPPELADNPEMQPTISPQTYGHLFRVLYNATYLNHNASAQTLGYFARSTFDEGLEAGVPPGTTVAHKFGTHMFDDGRDDPAQLHDCGIVYTPSRPYFLCVMTQGRDHATLAGVIAEISRFVYAELFRQSQDPAVN